MQSKFIIFDLDGTISDPKDGIVRSMNHSLEFHGFATRDEYELVQYIGPPLDKSFTEMTASSDRELVLSLVATYRERYAEVGYSENVLYEGIVDSLETLAQKYPLALCTSKRVDFAEQILSLFNLSHLFQVVSGGDVGIRKTQQLAGLLAESAIGPDSIMVGDRRYDLIGARDNDLRSIGVLWGYGDYQELSAEGPAMILKTPEQLTEVIT